MANRGWPSKARIALVALLAAGLVGCGSSADSSAPSAAPAPVEINYVSTWSVEPGVDVGSRAVELVRATMESGQLAGVFGLSAVPFPGYVEAVSRAQVGKSLSTYVSPTPLTGKTFPGWIMYHFAALRVTDATIQATVCRLSRDYAGRSRDEGDLSPQPSLVLSLRPEANVVEFERVPGVDEARRGERDDDPDARDRRALKVPDWDAFKGWRITVLDNRSPYGWGDPERAENPEACVQWWQEVFPTWTRVPMEFKGTPYAGDRWSLLAPSGDARTKAQVAVLPPDYPEWIPPSGRDA